MLAAVDTFTELTNGKEFVIHDSESFIDSHTRGMMIPLRGVLAHGENAVSRAASPVAVARPTDRASARRASAVVFDTSKTLVPCGFSAVVAMGGVKGEDGNDDRDEGRPYVHVIGVAGMKIRSQILGTLLTSQCLERLSSYLNRQVRAHRFGVHEMKDPVGHAM